MGGGCSTKRSIITNDASTKIEQNKNNNEQKAENKTKNTSKLELNKTSKPQLVLNV